MQVLSLRFLQFAGAPFNPPFQIIIDRLELFFRFKQRRLGLLAGLDFEAEPAVRLLRFLMGEDEFGGAFRHPLFQFGMRPAQFLQRLPALPPDAGLPQFPTQRLRQPRIMALHDDIVKPGLHRLHDLLFADRSRDQEQGDVQALLLDDPESIHPGERRQVVIDNGDVPVVGFQGGLHCLRRVDPRAVGGIPPFAHFLHRQQGVVFRVFDQQQPQIPGCHAALPNPGVSLTSIR